MLVCKLKIFWLFSFLNGLSGTLAESRAEVDTRRFQFSIPVPRPFENGESSSHDEDGSIRRTLENKNFNISETQVNDTQRGSLKHQQSPFDDDSSIKSEDAHSIKKELNSDQIFGTESAAPFEDTLKSEDKATVEEIFGNTPTPTPYDSFTLSEDDIIEKWLKEERQKSKMEHQHEDAGMHKSEDALKSPNEGNRRTQQKTQTTPSNDEDVERLEESTDRADEDSFYGDEDEGSETGEDYEESKDSHIENEEIKEQSEATTNKYFEDDLSTESYGSANTNDEILNAKSSDSEKSTHKAQEEIDRPLPYLEPNWNNSKSDLHSNEDSGNTGNSHHSSATNLPETESEGTTTVSYNSDSIASISKNQNQGESIEEKLFEADEQTTKDIEADHIYFRKSVPTQHKIEDSNTTELTENSTNYGDDIITETTTDFYQSNRRIIGEDNIYTAKHETYIPNPVISANEHNRRRIVENANSKEIVKHTITTNIHNTKIEDKPHHETSFLMEDYNFPNKKLSGDGDVKTNSEEIYKAMTNNGSIENSTGIIKSNEENTNQHKGQQNESINLENTSSNTSQEASAVFDQTATSENSRKEINHQNKNIRGENVQLNFNKNEEEPMSINRENNSHKTEPNEQNTRRAVDHSSKNNRQENIHSHTNDRTIKNSAQSGPKLEVEMDVRENSRTLQTHKQEEEQKAMHTGEEPRQRQAANEERVIKYFQTQADYQHHLNPETSLEDDANQNKNKESNSETTINNDNKADRTKSPATESINKTPVEAPINNKSVQSELSSVIQLHQVNTNLKIDPHQEPPHERRANEDASTNNNKKIPSGALPNSTTITEEIIPSAFDDYSMKSQDKSHEEDDLNNKKSNAGRTGLQETVRKAGSNEDHVKLNQEHLLKGVIAESKNETQLYPSNPQSAHENENTFKDFVEDLNASNETAVIDPVTTIKPTNEDYININEEHHAKGMKTESKDDEAKLHFLNPQSANVGSFKHFFEDPNFFNTSVAVNTVRTTKAPNEDYVNINEEHHREGMKTAKTDEEMGSHSSNSQHVKSINETEAPQFKDHNSSNNPAADPTTTNEKSSIEASSKSEADVEQKHRRILSHITPFQTDFRNLTMRNIETPEKATESRTSFAEAIFNRRDSFFKAQLFLANKIEGFFSCNLRILYNGTRLSGLGPEISLRAYETEDGEIYLGWRTTDEAYLIEFFVKCSEEHCFLNAVDFHHYLQRNQHEEDVMKIRFEDLSLFKTKFGRLEEHKSTLLSKNGVKIYFSNVRFGLEEPAFNLEASLFAAYYPYIIGGFVGVFLIAIVLLVSFRKWRKKKGFKPAFA